MELKFKHLTTALLLAGIASTQASAKDLYLSATGDDANDGLSAANAVKTLRGINGIIEKNDVVHVSGIIDVSVEAERDDVVKENNKWTLGGVWVQSNSGNYQGFNISSRDNTQWQGISFIGENPETDGFTGSEKTPLFIIRGKNNNGTKFQNLCFINGISNIDGGTLVFRDEAVVEFDNCHFKNNHPDWDSYELEGNLWKVKKGNDGKNIPASEKGGAIRTEGNCQLTFNGCLFENNINRQGGAMLISGTAKDRECSGWININNSIFRNNSAQGCVDGNNQNYLDNSKGGAIAVYALNNEVYLNINGCLFENNSVWNDAGAIWLYDNTNYGHYCDITIANSAFYENRSINGNGGAIVFAHTNTQFADKDYVTSRKVKVLNSTFYKNRAKVNGGAFYFHGSATNPKYDDYPQAELWMVNVTMVGNETEGNSGHGAGYKAENDGESLIVNAKRHFYNCIFEGNYARHYDKSGHEGGEPSNKEASDFCYAFDFADGLDIDNCYFGRMIDPINKSNPDDFIKEIDAKDSKIGYCVAYPKEGEDDVLYLANDIDALNIFEATRNNINGPHLTYIPLPDDSELKTAGNPEWLKMEDSTVENPAKPGVAHPLSGYDISETDQMEFPRFFGMQDEINTCAVGAAEAPLSNIMEMYEIESLKPAEPVAPEMPEFITDGLDIDEDFIKGEDTVTVTFKEVDGIDIYYLIGDAENKDENVNATADEAADEAGSVEPAEDACTEDHTGYTKYDGNAIKLTSNHGSLTFFACDPKNNLHSQAKTFKLDIATGIESIEAITGSKALYFNLQGVQVENPEKGVFIRVSNGKAEKVVK